MSQSHKSYYLWGAIIGFWICSLTAWQATAQTLPRRAHLGAQIGTLTPAIKRAYRLPDSLKGIIFYKIFPAMAADQANLQPQDIVRTINNQKVSEAAELVRAVAQAKGGDSLRFEVLRKDSTFVQNIVLGFYPREYNLFFETFYTSVCNAQGDTLSLIYTKPNSDNAVPLALLLPKDKSISVEYPFLPREGLYRYVETLSRQGIATLRIEQRGCGDDRRSPDSCQTALITDWQASLSTFKRYAFIDTKKVFLLDEAENNDAYFLYQNLDFVFAGFISSSKVGNPHLHYDPEKKDFLFEVVESIK
ncbi:MAG: PDZ domain-containing protein [Bernardetiaceae bacterium]|nr:PDZ domain-containing protein [Bernardetiaceae bacterium]